MKLKDIKMHPTSGLATSMYMSSVVHFLKKSELVLDGEDDFQECLKISSLHVYRCGWSRDHFSGRLIASVFNEALQEAVDFLSAIGLPIAKITEFTKEERAKIYKKYPL